MSIIRKRTKIDGYVGIYSCEQCAKPSYCVEIYKKTLFGKPKLIKRYYMVFHIWRTIGIEERRFGKPSVAKPYGDVDKCGYIYMDYIAPKSLKSTYPSLLSW